MWDAQRDARLRREAMAWLTLRTHDGELPISTRDLLDFRFDDEPFRLKDPQRGIRKPAVLSSALSMTTVYRPPDGRRPYDDHAGDDGLVRYKWRGEDGDHAENRALRAAKDAQVPLIWFFGVGPALWLPRFPVYILSEERSRQQFVVDLDVGRGLVEPGSVVEENVRRYITVQTRQRLHQPVFRATVMRAYTTRCAVCSLAHGELLDAAHIIPDSASDGVAAVTNGLSLCKLHHSAFDANILGISPDLRVSIREDLLAEVDGPTLRHGLQDRHGETLRVIPRVRAERPSPELLERRFGEFLASTRAG